MLHCEGSPAALRHVMQTEVLQPYSKQASGLQLTVQTDPGQPPT